MKGYSVYENKNKDLVDKIKSIKLNKSIQIGDVIEHRFLGKCEILSQISDNEFLINSLEHDKRKIFKINDEFFIDRHLQEINDTFFVGDYFTQNFGILGKNKTILHGIKKPSENPFGRKESYKEVKLTCLLKEDFSYSKNTHSGISFEYSKSQGNVCCFFNENGDYVVRDHNLKLHEYQEIDYNEYKNNIINDYLIFLSDNIPNELWRKPNSNLWFCDNYAYKLSFNKEDCEIYNGLNINVYMIPKQRQDTFYYDGDSYNSIRKPKKCELQNKSVLINEIENYIKNL